MSAAYKTSTPFQYGGGDDVLTLSPGKRQGHAMLSIESVTQRGVDGGGSIDLNPTQLRDLAAHLTSQANELEGKAE